MVLFFGANIIPLEVGVIRVCRTTEFEEKLLRNKEFWQFLDGIKLTKIDWNGRFYLKTVWNGVFQPTVSQEINKAEHSQFGKICINFLDTNRYTTVQL